MTDVLDRHLERELAARARRTAARLAAREFARRGRRCRKPRCRTGFPARRVRGRGLSQPVQRPEDLQRRRAAGASSDDRLSCATFRISTIRRAECWRATVGGFRVINLYVPNGQAPGSEKFAYKLRWLEALTALARRARPQPHPALVVLATSTSRRKTATCTIRLRGSVACT